VVFFNFTHFIIIYQYQQLIHYLFMLLNYTSWLVTHLCNSVLDANSLYTNFFWYIHSPPLYTVYKQTLRFRNRNKVIRNKGLQYDCTLTNEYRLFTHLVIATESIAILSQNDQEGYIGIMQSSVLRNFGVDQHLNLYRRENHIETLMHNQTKYQGCQNWKTKTKSSYKST